MHDSVIEHLTDVERTAAKELAERLLALDFGGRMPPSVIEESAEELERLQRELSNVSEQYTNYHDWAQAEIQRLREDLRRTESAHAVVMAENKHYKQRAVELERERDSAVTGLSQLRNFANQQWESVQRRLSTTETTGEPPK